MSIVEPHNTHHTKLQISCVTWKEPNMAVPIHDLCALASCTRIVAVVWDLHLPLTVSSSAAVTAGMCCRIVDGCAVVAVAWILPAGGVACI
jgi:hypothetical protein